MSHYFIDKQDPRVADLLRRLENTGKALKKWSRTVNARSTVNVS